MTSLRQRWRRWIDARSPRSDRMTCTQRNVYIVPTKGALGYAAVVLVLLLAAINEQLNLAYALAFLLAGVGLSAMWLTHGNLRGLSVSLGALNSVHAGQPLLVRVMLEAGPGSRGHHGLLISQPDRALPPLPSRWRRKARAQVLVALADQAPTGGEVQSEVAAGHQQVATVAVEAPVRGWLSLPRLRVQTTYPLGLFVAWGYWRAERRVLVWPALELAPPPLPDIPADGGGPVGLSSATVELPDGLRPWRRGDTIRSVAWKKSATRLASGQAPVSREATGRPRLERWIEWEHAAGLATELRLSRLAAWLVIAERQASQDGQPYGLRLPGLSVAPAHGPVQLHQCLDALATWGDAS